MVSSDEAVFSAEGVREVAAGLVRDELVVVPVRHHSPACGVLVRRLIRERRPSVVLVEGPRSFSELIPLLTDSAARMPLAVYSYASRGSERWAAYFPFCDYSPELVALREAAAAGVPSRFIDLDLAEQQTIEAEAVGEEGVSLLDERHFRHSRSLELLAKRLGCTDDEDLWELLFESDAGTTEPAEQIARMAAYCLLARADRSEAELTADGTTLREAEMAWHVREALRSRSPGDGPVLVVLGGFHGVVLPQLLADDVPRPEIDVDGVTGQSALIRYTFERLERLNGYGAGMTAPAWHQRLWQQLVDPPAGQHPRVAATLTAVLDISAELRDRHRVPLPMPAVAAAFEQAVRLAELRERPAPLRSDLLDAVQSCFVKGDIGVEGVLVRAACRQTLTGEVVGELPPGAGLTPLVEDARQRLRAQRIRVDDAGRHSVSLDLYRSAAHRETSRLLHGLRMLGVPIANRTAGPDFVGGFELNRLHEKWEVGWSPIVEGTLVEASVYGSTVPTAVATRFGEVLAARRTTALGARQASSLLVQACVLGLHEQAAVAVELVREQVAAEVSFVEVATAVSQLALLWEAREPLEARRLGDELLGLVRSAYQRALLLGRQLNGEPWPVAAALVQLRDLLVSTTGSGLDAELYWELIDVVAAEHSSTFVRGAATGLAYSAGRVASGELSRQVAAYLAGGLPVDESVAFLCGVLLTAREAAWHEQQLLTELDRRLAAWDQETFVRHLPELRLAFAELTPSETDRVAGLVAHLKGLTELGPLTTPGVTADEVDDYLAVSARVAAQLAADGLAEWSGERR
ncbi:hypothetical protein HPO96_30680 [Kribbella sandramycini]|uniref:Uncharacterized protein n=1 Tax=Kribbella sandramycini TaxID=60450 RepID=A0A7Y4L759_9ACTN|nr:DUF5682 family protein [Kribbella sandramycini]MBB6566900.1 hypothetical protein [Kribbella sandramycini]NOL44622.1 hypothetical protein [Kribbella sandramycini]